MSEKLKELDADWERDENGNWVRVGNPEATLSHPASDDGGDDDRQFDDLIGFSPRSELGAAWASMDKFDAEMEYDAYHGEGDTMMEIIGDISVEVDNGNTSPFVTLPVDLTFARDYLSGVTEKKMREHATEMSRLMSVWAADTVRDDDVSLSIKENSVRTDDMVANVTLRPYNPPEELVYHPSTDSAEDYVGEIVGVHGTVVVESEPEMQATELAFECRRCGSTSYIPQDKSRNVKTPNECSGCEREGPFAVDHDNSEYVETQILVVKDSVSGGETQPRELTVRVEGDLVDSATGGDDVTIIGTLTGVVDDDEPGVLETELRAVSVNQRDVGVDYSVSHEEEHRIEKIADGDDVINRLTESVAPHIEGLENAKQAILLQAASPETFERADGSKTIGNIHVAFIGDSGTGKSALMEFAEVLNKHSVSSSATASTAAGLTVAATKEEVGGKTTKVMRPGLLPLADGGIAVIDELDKLDADATVMNTAMSKGVLETSKYGMHTTIPTDCSVLAASNPIHGDFAPRAPLDEQVDFSPSILNRFDIRVAFQDTVDEERDRKVAKSIINQHREESEPDAEFDTEFLAKYVAYCVDNANPSVTDTVVDEVEDTYVLLRDKLDATLKGRFINGCIKLAKASATLRLSDTVDKRDADVATGLMIETLDSWGYNTSRFDAAQPEWPQNEVVQAIFGTMQDMDTTPSGVSVAEIEAEMEKPIPVSRIETVIEQLNGRQKVRPSGETDDGVQKWVRVDN